MVDLDYLAKLLSILSSSRVSSFESQGLKLSFHVLEQSPIVSQELKKSEVVEVPEDQLPPDLRTDNINSMDTILNWSTAPEEKLEPIPGVNDHPLEGLE